MTEDGKDDGGDVEDEFETLLRRGLTAEGSRLKGVPPPSPEDLLLMERWEAQKRSSENLDRARERRHREQHTLLHSDVRLIRGAEHAPRFVERHNYLLISEIYIIAVEILTGNTEQVDRLLGIVASDAELMQRLRQRGLLDSLQAAAATCKSAPGTLLQVVYRIAEDLGFFVKKYSTEHEAAYLESSDTVVSELTIPKAPGSMERLATADCQGRLPRMDAEKPIMDMPDVARGDRIFDPAFVQNMHTHPQRYAIVDDITSVVPNSGHAGLARNFVFDTTIKVINPLRGEHAIEDFAAEIALIEGLERPDGSAIMLRDLPGNTKPVKNEHSLQAHIHSRWDARLAFYLSNRRVPFQIGDQQYHIIMGWLVHFLSLSSAKKKEK